LAPRQSEIPWEADLRRQRRLVEAVPVAAWAAQAVSGKPSWYPPDGS
jgi:hypothetical protein